MARTKAQINRPKAVYGKQIIRGNKGEQKAIKQLQREGYIARLSDTHPRGKADVIAKKGKVVRNIQVKTISSRNFNTATSARKRIAGKPFNLKRLRKDCELWVYDKSGRLYRFTK